MNIPPDPFEMFGFKPKEEHLLELGLPSDAHFLPARFGAMEVYSADSLTHFGTATLGDSRDEERLAGRECRTSGPITFYPAIAPEGPAALPGPPAS